MKRTGEPMVVAIACAFIGMTVSALSVVAVTSLKEFHPSAIIRMSESEPLAELARSIDPNFQFVTPDAHYDGVYYYAIALDPFATGEAHQLIDLSSYRYSHAGYGWAAWIVSLGFQSAVPIALLAIGLVSMGVASGVGSLISTHLGRSPWGGLFVALNPGIIYSVSADTGEPFAAALLGLLFLAWWRGRWVWVGLLVVVLCITKEIFLLVAAALFVWKLLDVLRTGNRVGMIPALAAASAGPIMWTAWQAYLYERFDAFALSGVPKSIYLPLQGWLESLSIAAGLSFSTADSQQIGQIAVPLIIAVGTLLLIGIYYARRLRTELEAVYLFLAAITLCLGPLQVVYPKDLLRLAATPLILLPAVVARRPGNDLGVVTRET